MIQIDMEKPSACRWTDEENCIHLCPFLDSEYECILQGHIGYWSWGGQYKNCPLHEVTTDPDTVSRQAVLDALAQAIPSLTTPDGAGEYDHEIQIAAETRERVEKGA